MSISIRLYMAMALSTGVALAGFFLFYTCMKPLLLRVMWQPWAYNLLILSLFLAAMLVFALCFHLCIRERIAYLLHLARQVRQDASKVEVRGQDELSALAESIGEAYRELNQLRIREQRERRRRDAMLSNLSHDLRTPLTSVLGYLDLIRQGDCRPEHAEVAYRKAQQLSHLAEELFDYLRFSDSQSPFHPVLLDVGLFLRQYVSEQSTVVLDRQIALQLPEASCLLLVDPYLFHRLLDNLFSNALQHGRGEISIRLYEDQAYWAMVVENECLHAAPVDVERLFDRFYTGDKSRHRGGTGLGLPIVQAIAARHDAEIAVSAVQGVFSLSVSFPKHGAVHPQKP